MPDSLGSMLLAGSVRCGADCASKKRALETIATLIAGSDDSALFDRLNERERLGSTGIGEGIAIPHCRLRGSNTVRAALVTLRAPIEFEAIDDRPVDILFALVVPEDATGEHLAMLARLAELFSSATFRTRIRDCHSDEELHRTMLSAWETA